MSIFQSFKKITFYTIAWQVTKRHINAKFSQLGFNELNTMQHLIKEYHSKYQCIYCNKDLSDMRWVSVFEDGIHYKQVRCSCGKINKIKVNKKFLSSGHDSWDGKSFIGLDELKNLKKDMNLEKRLI